MIQRLAWAAPFLFALSGCAVSASDLEGEEPTSTSEEAFTWHTAIDFDHDPSGAAILNGTNVDSLYASAGVTFSSIFCGNTSSCVPASAYARPTGNPGNGVSLYRSTYSGFDNRYGAIEAAFATPPFQVTIDVLGTPFVEGLGTITAKPWIAAYDSAGQFMSIVYGTATPNVWQTLTITGANIAKVRFSSQAISPYMYANFDNLTFDTQVQLIKLPPRPPRLLYPLTLAP